MNFRLLDRTWASALYAELAKAKCAIKIICPFIKENIASHIIQNSLSRVQVITRFNQADFAQGVSDTSALRILLSKSADIRGIKRLHAKLYLIDSETTILTSANLTAAALHRNHEFGFISDDVNIAKKCHEYFDNLWNHAGRNLVPEQLDEWDAYIATQLLARPTASKNSAFTDEGVDIDLASDEPLYGWLSEADHGFVKFFGNQEDRVDRSTSVLYEINRSGSHWACTYPRVKCPRKVKEGAIMFMGRMVKNPSDTIIYGRAIAMAHKDGRDDATPADIQLRNWKSKYPCYIRVHDAEFVAGTLANGISLNALMAEFSSDSFRTTQSNARKGTGNTNPRRSCRQQAAVDLSVQARTWLNEKLEDAFAKHGKLVKADLAHLDWPTLPT